MKIIQVHKHISDTVSDLTTEMDELEHLIVIKVTKDGTYKFKTTMDNKNTLYALDVAKFDTLFDEKMDFKLKHTH